MKNKIETTVKIILAALLFGCLFHMPYGYYGFMRIASITGFAILAYNNHKRGNAEVTIIYCGLILLFQPFAKIHLGRDLWQLVDVVIASGLLLSLFYKRKRVRK